MVLSTVGCAPPGPRAPEQATASLRREIEVGAPLQTKLSFLIAGDPTGPRVILVHGTPGSATGWTDYLLNVPSGAEIVAIDRPGFGQSGPEGAVTSLAGQAAAVVAHFPKDGRPVVLLGHSLGGPIVARVAADHPQRVAAVVLLSAALDPLQEKIHPMQYLGSWLPVRAMLPRTIRNANAELMALKSELEALAPMLPLIRAKVVILHGTNDDLVPIANVPYMEKRLTGARCVKTILLEGHNHFLPWNSVAAVRNALGLAMSGQC